MCERIFSHSHALALSLPLPSKFVFIHFAWNPLQNPNYITPKNDDLPPTFECNACLSECFLFIGWLVQFSFVLLKHTIELV